MFFKKCQDCQENALCMPRFVRGNDGVAGLKWISVSKMTDEAKVDPFAPDESDEDFPPGPAGPDPGPAGPEPRRRGPLERAMRYVLRR